MADSLTRFGNAHLHFNANISQQTRPFLGISARFLHLFWLQYKTLLFALNRFKFAKQWVRLLHAFAVINVFVRLLNIE